MTDADTVHQTTLAADLAAFELDVTTVSTTADLRKQIRKMPLCIALLDLSRAMYEDFSWINNVGVRSCWGLIVLVDQLSEHDGIRALHHGADICLQKPAAPALIVASTCSLARRLLLRRQARSEVHPFKNVRPAWHLDSTGWSLVSPEGVVVALTPAERLLVGALLAAGSVPVNRETLIGALSSDPLHFDPHRPHMLVLRLRRKISKLTREATPVLTVRSMGYRFAPEAGPCGTRK